MPSRARVPWGPLAVATSFVSLLGWLGLRTVAFTDYETEAEPALQALQAGDLGAFLDLLPAYGGSLIVRSPFALLPDAWGGADLALFRSMAVPCLAAGVVLAVVLWTRARLGGAGRGAGLAVLALAAGNPLTLRALETGHPEELLGGVLCVLALIAAGADRPLLAGVLVGLAVANKPWAVIAVAPVVLTLPSGRGRALGVAIGTAALFVIPLALAGSSAVTQAGAAARDSGQIFQPWQLWWFFGDHGQTVTGLFGEKVGYRAAPGWVGQIARPLVVAVPLVLCLALARRLRERPWHDGLLLLALVLLLRCVLDPWNVVYYELPFLLALVAWEVHARPGSLPAISIAATLLCWVTLEQLTTQASPDVQAVAFLAWSVPAATTMMLALWCPAVVQRFIERLRSRSGLPSPARP